MKPEEFADILAVRNAEVRDSIVVCGGKQHGASTLDDSVVIDVFTPCREDYL